MRLLVMDKQWSAAQNQYIILRRYLREQLAVEPSQASVSLFDEIRTAAAHNTILPPHFPLARHNLPDTPTPFVGRDEVLDFLSERLSDPECRLLSLLGPGGIGKTRLALGAAHNQVGIAADGVFFVPLGVELAAAATWDCTCGEIAQRIASGFDELTAYASNVAPCHRNLRAAFDVSWQLLSAGQQKVFSQLSVFRGGFEIAAIEAVVGESLALDILHQLLSALAEKSLLRRAATGRYDLHEQSSNMLPAGWPKNLSWLL